MIRDDRRIFDPASNFDPASKEIERKEQKLDGAKSFQLQNEAQIGIIDAKKIILGASYLSYPTAASYEWCPELDQELSDLLGKSILKINTGEHLNTKSLFHSVQEQKKKIAS